jgi:hypothetical protein
MRLRIAYLLVGTALAAAALASPASAKSRGGSDNGDSWINDSVRNPRFAQPGGDYDDARYRASHPHAGYEDRVLAAQGIYNEGSGLPRPSYRGRVVVQPYSWR